MRPIFYLLLILFCTSCSTNYYLCTVDKPTAVYKVQDTSTVILYISPGKQLIAGKRGKQYRTVQYGQTTGYILNRSFPRELLYSKKELQRLTFNYDSTYAFYKRSPPVAEPSASTGGSVQVKGYYRKDGTYVRPHTRKSPKRRS